MRWIPAPILVAVDVSPESFDPVTSGIGGISVTPAAADACIIADITTVPTSPATSAATGSNSTMAFISTVANPITGDHHSAPLRCSSTGGLLRWGTRTQATEVSDMTPIDPAQESLRHWSAVAPAWESYRDRLFEHVRPVSEWLVDAVDPQPGQTVLEVTAGPGETGFLAARRLGPDGRLVSSDFVPAMVEAAQRGAARQGLDNVECRVLDVQQIDQPDDSVDGVLSRFGLMLVPEQERAMGEIRRVLRPGGRFAYATWGPPDRNPWIFQIVLALLQNGHAPPGDAFAPGGVFSLATPDRNRELATAGGFADVGVEELTGTMRFDSRDDYWTFNTSVAGPVALLVSSLDDDQVGAVRATLDSALAPFEHDGGIEMPWLSVVTSAV